MTRATQRISLVLLPGTLNTAVLWQAQVAALSAHADIHLADLTQQDSIAAMADHVLARMPEGRFALAGFSLGGYVALEIMRRAADRVLALALINSSARPETPEGQVGREKTMALAQRDFARLTSTLIQHMLPPERQEDSMLVANIRAMMNELGAPVFVRQSRVVLARADSRADLSAIRCPTLIVTGADDKVAPPRFSEEMAAALSDAQLHILPATGHLSPMERPEQVTGLMQTWLARAVLPGGPPLHPRRHQ